MFSSPNAWTIYDGLTGQQVATVKNVPAWTAFGADSNGNLIGYIAATNSSAFGPNLSDIDSSTAYDKRSWSSPIQS